MNYYDTLNERLYNNEEEVNYLKGFLSTKDDVDAVAIFINKNEQGFVLDSVSSKEDIDLARIGIGGKSILFNEPFYNLQNKMITNKLLDFSKIYNLDDSLGDTLFLLNNTILDVIANGKELDIKKDDDNVLALNIKNTVGGYVTIQIMTADNYAYNCLYRPYSFDYNTLLDKTTYPFSSFADSYPEIRYFDNLAMLIKGVVYENNEPFVKEQLIKCVEKQLKFLAELEFIKIYVLNEFIVLINKKYNLNFEVIKRQEEEGLLSLGVFLGEDRESIDLDYIKRFI